MAFSSSDGDRYLGHPAFGDGSGSALMPAIPPTVLMEAVPRDLLDVFDAIAVWQGSQRLELVQMRTEMKAEADRRMKLEMRLAALERTWWNRFKGAMRRFFLE